jgi:uncharacterized membrane protein YqaE (UPF0057 family)
VPTQEHYPGQKQLTHLARRVRASQESEQPRVSGYSVYIWVEGGHDQRGSSVDMVKVLLVILCLFLPFLAVLIKDGPCLKVLWAFLLQLCGHIPGVIYGIYQVVKD